MKRLFQRVRHGRLGEELRGEQVRRLGVVEYATATRRHLRYLKRRWGVKAVDWPAGSPTGMLEAVVG